MVLNIYIFQHFTINYILVVRATISLNKHDQYVELLRRKLEKHYDTIFTNVPIYRKKRRKVRVVGEIDILALKSGKYDIYEVKCSHRITKARMQLQKIKKNSTLDIRRSYFYCGSSQILVKM